MHRNVFEQIYGNEQQRPPWDLDGPTPFVADLEGQNEFQGTILDAGCGTGENALFLAAHGHTVVGMDAAPTAVARAREKAQQRQLQATFVEADACDIAGYSNTFETVLDCGFFHVLSPEDQSRYVKALNRATTPNAVLHLMAFSDRNSPWREDRPTGCFTHGVSESELRDAFSSEWTIESLEEAPATLRGEKVAFWQARLKRRGASQQ
jgi:cyclopropane fatty-acyl-phospholipid synthase-like methyltransferase